MRVCVRLFARARDLAGTSLVELELEDGATVADLRRKLAATFPTLAALLAHSALAVDEEFAREDQVVRPGAEVALLPPVSGGSGAGPFSS